MPSELGRFTEPSLLILEALAAGPLHGYAITQSVQRDHGTTLGPGTLYGALARLEQRGLIAPVASDERRRPYRLTPRGRTWLREQLSALESFAAGGLTRLARAQR